MLSSCKKVSRILASEEEIGFWQKIQLRVHTGLCTNCRRFQNQLEDIGEAARNIFEETSGQEQSDLDDMKARIIESQESNKDGDGL